MKQYIAGSLVASILAVLTTVCAPGAYADGVVTWTDASGDHRWDNAKNWEPQVAPTAAYEVRIPSGDWRIVRAEGEPYYGKFYIEEGSGTVTLEGEGAGTTMYPATSANFRIGEGRQFAVANGLTLKLSYTTPVTAGVMRVRSGGSVVFNNNNAAESTIGGSARIFVEGGTFLNEKTGLHITNNAEIVVSDGLMHTKYYRVYGPDSPGDSGALLRITGGTLWNDYSYACWSKIYSGGRFENLGGTILWGADSDERYAKLGNETGHVYSSGDYGFSYFLPPKGGKLELLSRDGCTFNGGTDNAGALYFAVTGDYSFGGEIFATNTAAAAVDTLGCVCFEGGKTNNLTGGGTVYANGFMMRGQNIANLGISALYLGSGGIQQGQTCVTRFVNDLVLGAWGDWSALRGQYCRITFAGNLVFDTLDCFDKKTPHTISVQAGFLDVTSLKAVGGGSVALSPRNYEPPWPELLHSIVVGDNTSLAITNSSVTMAIKTSTLKLGAGSTLTFDVAEKRYIDVLGHLEVGSGARIVAKAPTSLTAGKIHPVFLAPADFDIPDGLVQLEGSLPSGWSLVRRANFLYLSDGEVSYTTASSQYYRYWTGAVDGDVDNVGNWTTNEIPFTVGTSSSYIYAFPCFEGSKNMDVTVSGPRNAYGINLTEKAGPFIFTGEPINLFYTPVDRRGGGSKDFGGVRSKSDLPCIVNNDVKNDYGGLYYALNYNSGSISLMGDQVQTSGTSDFYFCGDVRLGGTWNVSYFNVNTNSAALAAKCPHTLTLLSGASLSASDQDAQDFDRKQQFLLAPSSTLTIGGTTCRFLEANTHFIDGTLTVNGTLDAQAKQTFFGDGTTKFQSATGELDFNGNMTIIPGSFIGDVAVSLKGEPTIAPESDWTFGGDASIDLDDHSTLTLATGGHKLRLAKPLVSRGTLSVAGNGTIEIAAEGMSLDKVEMADGATFSVARNILSRGTQVDVLTVRDDDDSITFSADVPKLKKRVDERGYTIYSVKGGAGLSIFIR